MKKIFLLVVVLSVVSCKENNTSQTTTTGTKQMSEEEINAEALRVTDSAANAADYQAEVTVYGENPKVAEAKKLIDEATEFMNKGIRKEITVQQANAKINPLMEKFEKINAQLSSTEQEHLKNYRIEQAQKSIDLQVQQSN